MNNNPTITPQVVASPFKNFCMSVGAIPSSYQDSLDYYETLLWLIKFLDETVIPAVTTNGNAVAELQTFYLQLQTYVNDYFKNLDVQEEINNKLDNMAIDGSLTALIKDYVDPIYQVYENSINSRITNVEHELSSIASGSPLSASSISEMIDTTRIYVNTTNGYWYYYDGDSWEQGGVYQATEIPSHSITPAKTTFINNNNNLFDEQNVVLDKVISFVTGTLSDNESYFTSDFIEVEPSTNYYFNQNYRLVQFGSNKEYITGNEYVNSFITNDNTRYVRFSAQKTNITSTQLNKGNASLPLETYKLLLDKNIKINYDNIELNDNTIPFTKILNVKNSNNLFNKNTVILDKYISISNGELLDNENYFTSDFIEVKGNTDYYFNQNDRLVQFDSNKLVITGGLNITNIRTNINTKYIRITARKSNLEFTMVNEGNQLKPFENYYLLLDKVIKINNDNIIESSLNNKNIVFLGDSYTYPSNSYRAILGSRLNFNALNYGVPSSRISLDVTSNDNIIKSFITRFNELQNELGDNIEGIVIFGGINDGNSISQGAISLGNINDNVNSNTFYGKMKKLCEDIINRYPTKRILGIIPNNIQKYNAYATSWYNNLALVQVAEREIYNLYGIPYVDLQNECFEMGILNSLVSHYRQASDNIHPNDAGHNAIANTIENKLINIFEHKNI